MHMTTTQNMPRTVVELEELLRRLREFGVDDQARISVAVIPRDRPFDAEVTTITVNWETP